MWIAIPATKLCVHCILNYSIFKMFGHEEAQQCRLPVSELRNPSFGFHYLIMSCKFPPAASLPETKSYSWWQNISNRSSYAVLDVQDTYYASSPGRRQIAVGKDQFRLTLLLSKWAIRVRRNLMSAYRLCSYQVTSILTLLIFSGYYDRLQCDRIYAELECRYCSRVRMQGPNEWRYELYFYERYEVGKVKRTDPSYYENGGEGLPRAVYHLQIPNKLTLDTSYLRGTSSTHET